MDKTELVKKCLPFWEQLSKDEKERVEISLVYKAFSKGEFIS